MSALHAVRPAETVAGDEEDPAKRRRLFLIEGAAEYDALARLLAPFAVQQAVLTDVRYTEAGGRYAARLEAAGLTLLRAETLADRLRQCPIVSSVSFGWLGLATTDR